MLSMPKPVVLYTVAIVSLAVIYSGGVSLHSQSAQAITVHGTAVVPDLSGTWEGTWSDTRYFVDGALNLDIARNGDDYTATGTIDVSQIDPVLGTLSGTATGTIVGNTMTFSFNATNLGTGSGTFTDGSASGTGTVTAPLSFGAFEFAGTITAGQISGTFNFTSPTGGNGVASLNRSVASENSTLSELKASYR